MYQETVYGKGTERDKRYASKRHVGLRDLELSSNETGDESELL